METGLFEIQAAYLREFRQSRQARPLAKLSMRCSGGLTRLASMAIRISRGITNKTEAVASSGSLRRTCRRSHR